MEQIHFLKNLLPIRHCVPRELSPESSKTPGVTQLGEDVRAETRYRSASPFKLNFDFSESVSVHLIIHYFQHASFEMISQHNNEHGTDTES
jgi:hypothetical protein